METVAKAMASKSVVIGGSLLLIVLAMAALAGLVFPNDPLDLVGAPLQKPFESFEEPLGTDSTGRSVAAQLMYGARTSLLIGFIPTGVAVLTRIFAGGPGGVFCGLGASPSPRGAPGGSGAPGLPRGLLSPGAVRVVTS